jgi:hypothetical protein
VVELYLGMHDVQKLEKILPEYCSKRAAGMHAGVIAERVGLPLKDVISFLIDKGILSGEQVDLELARVMLARNSGLKRSILEKSGMPYREIDHALAVQDSKVLQEICGQFEFQQVYLLIPSFAMLTVSFGLSFELALGMCALFVSFLLAEAWQKLVPRTNAELVMRMFEGC